MNLQQQPQSKPQPLRVSLDAPQEQLYGLARNLRRDEAKRREFEEFPQALLQEYGLETNAISWELGKHGGKHDHPKPGGGKHKGDGDDSDAEVLVACVAIASDVLVGLLVCGAVAFEPDEPVEGQVQ